MRGHCCRLVSDDPAEPGQSLHLISSFALADLTAPHRSKSAVAANIPGNCNPRVRVIGHLPALDKHRDPYASTGGRVPDSLQSETLSSTSVNLLRHYDVESGD